MFYDAMGILFLILTGSFLLFLPLAAVGLVVCVTNKVRMIAMESGNSNAQAGIQVSTHKS